jgi:hypothetical protein
MSDGLLFVHTPRMSAESFARVLSRNSSPAAGTAADLYTIICSYNLDPAVALAFFAHESTYGKYGVAARSLNWGNLRRGARAYKVAGGFGYYHSWADSLRDWCELISSRYVARGLATVELEHLAEPPIAVFAEGQHQVGRLWWLRRLLETGGDVEQLGKARDQYQVVMPDRAVVEVANVGFAKAMALRWRSSSFWRQVASAEASP